MTRGVRLYLVGSFVLVSLAGCGRGFFQSAERAPWRAEAEVACLKSGAVKETADVVRISPISGPGVCGAEYPLKVAALGDDISSFGFADESLRPPGDIRGQHSRQSPLHMFARQADLHSHPHTYKSTASQERARPNLALGDRKPTLHSCRGRLISQH